MLVVYAIMPLLVARKALGWSSTFSFPPPAAFCGNSHHHNLRRRIAIQNGQLMSHVDTDVVTRARNSPSFPHRSRPRPGGRYHTSNSSRRCNRPCRSAESASARRSSRCGVTARHCSASCRQWNRCQVDRRRGRSRTAVLLTARVSVPAPTLHAHSAGFYVSSQCSRLLQQVSRFSRRSSRRSAFSWRRFWDISRRSLAVAISARRAAIMSRMRRRESSGYPSTWQARFSAQLGRATALLPLLSTVHWARSASMLNAHWRQH